MTDHYQRLADSRFGASMLRRLGLPAPVRLRRGDDTIDAPILLAAASTGRLAALPKALTETALTEDLDAPAPTTGFAALIFDATAVTDVAGLREVYGFFHPRIRRLASSGRVIVIGTPPAGCADARAATAQAALDGFIRSVGKELRDGATAQLLRIHPGADAAGATTVRFLLSPRSAFISGQTIDVTAADVGDCADPARPLAGKVALVTGAAGAIGTATAQLLADRGAVPVCLDVPGTADGLQALAQRLGGTALPMDITASDAPQQLAERLSIQHDGVDVVVHNAGITRDRTLSKLAASDWDAVMDINVVAPLRSTEQLLATGILHDGGRVVVMSSLTGIAGNVGQTNYSASKAGLIGMVRSLAPVVADRGITINAVAPGFIETRMTAAIPFLVRQVGRRLNSLSQGGLPIDVAETVGWLADPGSGGVNGNVVRVCGQSLLGA